MPVKFCGIARSLSCGGRREGARLLDGPNDRHETAFAMAHEDGYRAFAGLYVVKGIRTTWAMFQEKFLVYRRWRLSAHSGEFCDRIEGISDIVYSSPELSFPINVCPRMAVFRFPIALEQGFLKAYISSVGDARMGSRHYAGPASFGGPLFGTDIAHEGGYRVMRTFDLNPLLRSGVGFDRFDRILDSLSRQDDAQLSYPPYNIAKSGAGAIISTSGGRMVT